MLEMVFLRKTAERRASSDHEKNNMHLVDIMFAKQEQCRIARHVDQQRARPSVVGQAEVKIYATGCDGSSLYTTTSGYKKLLMTVLNV